MVWRIEIAPAAKKELDKLGREAARRVLTFLRKRVTRRKDSRSIGDATKGPEFGEYRRYRAGEYRIIARLEDDVLLLLVLRAGHRKHVYKQKP